MDSSSKSHSPDQSWWQIVKSSLSGEQHDFTSGKLGRAVVLLAIPMVLELVLESLFAVCDIFWVARLGSAAVAAVGLTESILTLCYAVAIGLAMAVTATVARRIGEKDVPAAAQAGAQGIYLAIGIGVLTGVPCILLAPNILSWMGASAAVIGQGTAYTQIVLGGNIVVMLLFLNNAIFRGAGDAAIAMRALWIANGLNLVLDPLLIFGVGPFPALGLTGAAVATLIGRTAGVVYQFRALHNRSSRIVLNGAAWRPEWERMIRLVRVSLGGIGQLMVGMSSWLLLMRIMARFGDEALSGYTIAIRIIIFTILPSWGLSNAAATLTGQSLGAGKPERAVRAVWMTGWLNMGFLAVVMVVFLLFARPIVEIFTDNATEVGYAVKCLRILGLAYLFYGWGMVLTQAFNGAGDTLTPTWLNLIAFWAFQLPMAWLLAVKLGLGPQGVFWTVSMADVLLVLLAFPVFLSGKWKERTV